MSIRAKERASWWYRRVMEKYPDEIADSIKRSEIAGPIGIA